MSSKKSTPSGTTKCTNFELNSRVNEVKQWILHGYTRHDILQNAAEWRMSERQMDEYIARARDEIKEINQASIEENLSTVLRNYWQLYRKSFEANAIAHCTQILMCIAKLQGLEKYTLIIKDERELESLSDAELNIMLRGDAGDRDPAEA